MVLLPRNFPGEHLGDKQDLRTCKVPYDTIPVSSTITSIKTSKEPLVSKALNEDVSKQVFLEEE